MAKGAAALKWLGRGYVGPVPVPVLVFLLAFAVAGVVLARTRFGRHVHAVGDDEEAAHLMGLDVGRVRLKVYALSGALAGLGGVLLAARVGLGQPTAGLGWELTAITAVIVGASASEGGRAGAGATLTGLLVLALLINLLNLEGTLTSYWQWVIRGAFLLVVVLTQDRLRRAAQAG